MSAPTSPGVGVDPFPDPPEPVTGVAARTRRPEPLSYREMVDRVLTRVRAIEQERLANAASLKDYVHQLHVHDEEVNASKREVYHQIRQNRLIDDATGQVDAVPLNAALLDLAAHCLVFGMTASETDLPVLTRAQAITHRDRATQPTRTRRKKKPDDAVDPDDAA